MKNKFGSIILSLYVLLIIIFSFNPTFIDNVNLSIVNIFTNNVNKFNIIYDIIHYVELFIFYLGFSVCVTVVCIDNFDQFKYILIYSIILSLLVAIISMTIKSFYVSIHFFDILTILISIIIGISIEIIFKIKQNRR